jgi:hypothetical protein
MEVTQFLYETTGNFIAEVNAANKTTLASGWELSSMLRGRLVVILPQDSQSHLQKLFSNRGKIPDYQQLLE